jgi:hypothetical protein
MAIANPLSKNFLSIVNPVLKHLLMPHSYRQLCSEFVFIIAVVNPFAQTLHLYRSYRQPFGSKTYFHIIAIVNYWLKTYICVIAIVNPWFKITFAS